MPLSPLSQLAGQSEPADGAPESAPDTPAGGPTEAASATESLQPDRPAATPASAALVAPSAKARKAATRRQPPSLPPALSKLAKCASARRSKIAHSLTDCLNFGGDDGCCGGTASSGQLFGMFKAMATGASDEVEVAVDGEDSRAPSIHEPALVLGEDPPTDGEDNTYRDWYDDNLIGAKNVGEKFAAMAMSAYSPYGDRDLELDTVDADSDGHRGSIDSLDGQPPTLSTASGVSTPASSGPATPTDSNASYKRGSGVIAMPELERSRFRRDEFSEADKLKVIQEEFGDVASKMVNDDGTPGPPERILAEAQGMLFKGVMMIGNLHLTTHRLVFHALLPPDSAWGAPSTLPDQTDAQAQARFERPNIIKSGPMTVHRDGLTSRKKRVWMELSPDMFTTYPSGDESGRVRPLYSVLLNTVIRLAPLDENAPCDFFVTFETPTGRRTSHFSADNEPSALAWRRHFESVLFRHARQRFRDAHYREAIAQGMGAEEARKMREDESWSMLRCCVPLDSTTIEGMGEYHSFATLISLNVKLEDDTHVTWHPEKLADGQIQEYHTLAVNTKDLAKEKDKLAIMRTDSPKRMSFDSSVVSPSSEHEDDHGSRLGRTLKRALRLNSKDGGSPASSRESSLDRAKPLRQQTVPLKPSPLYDLEQTESAPAAMEGQTTPGSTTPRLNQYIDATMPCRDPTLNAHFNNGKCGPADGYDGAYDHSFQVMVAVLNDQKAFADAVMEAVGTAHHLKYREGEVASRLVLDVGGYDCLAKDDASDHEQDSSRDDSHDSHDSHDDEDVNQPVVIREARKAEKAAMASRVFGLREDEGIWLKRCNVQNGLVPARGHIILTPRYVCFWRRANIGADIKYRFPVRDVKSAEKSSPLRLGMNGMRLKIHGQHDVRFDFTKASARDETVRRIMELVERVPVQQQASVPTVGPDESALVPEEKSASTDGSALSIWERERGKLLEDGDLHLNPALTARGGDKPLKAAAEVLAPPPDLLLYPSALSDEALSYMPFVANRPWLSKSGWNVRLSPRTFTMLTIGSRGDVQPYIALGLRLMADGHKVVIVTHDEFKGWIEGYGIEHRQAGGDPTALMKISTDHKMFSPGFFKEALGSFRQWLDELLRDAWFACQDADVLIESPSAMAGVHIAEALKIPYFRAFTMPWTRTSAYPQAFMVPAFEMGPSFNYSTYVLFDNIMWKASSGQINSWRKKYLGLPSTDQSSLSISKVPFLYNFSPAVVPKPLDWYDDITITGYWNLENSDMDWSPPDSLVEFMDKAKRDRKALVYIGFGSIVVPDPAAVTKSIVAGVEKAGVRAIIAKGWSARLDSGEKKTDDVPLPESCYPLDKVPHSWLFPKVQAAMHHGGAGTVGASLRAGIPTLIKPWFGDQHFWALRVAKLGAGMKVASLKSDDIAEALHKATTDRVMIEKAARIGERIRSESGVDVAVQAIILNIMRAARDRKKLKKDERQYANRDAGIPRPRVPMPKMSLPFGKHHDKTERHHDIRAEHL